MTNLILIQRMLYNRLVVTTHFYDGFCHYSLHYGDCALLNPYMGFGEDKN